MCCELTWHRWRPPEPGGYPAERAQGSRACQSAFRPPPDRGPRRVPGNEGPATTRGYDLEREQAMSGNTGHACGQAKSDFEPNAGKTLVLNGAWARFPLRVDLI